ncbi:MAG: dicarboxylate/amino acid:cation symporter, partial [Bacteroidales bacterium]|nr:dicarboxylate/amino acid:cation symporter [Bacteroidales bacterium]
MNFKYKPGLLTKIIVAIALGIVSSLFFPLWLVRFFITLNGVFGNFLSFIIPLLILGLVAPGIADLGKGAGRLLGITAMIAYASTLIAGFFSFFTTKWALPILLDPNDLLSDSAVDMSDAISNFFTIDMPPLMGVTTALVLAFVIGLGVGAVNGERLKAALGEFRNIIILIIKEVIIPFLPLYIFGIFLKIGAEGQVPVILGL